MPDRWQDSLKQGIGWLVFRSGLHRWFLRGKALVVAFHTIGNEGNNNSIQVTPEMFEKYCAYFKKYFRVVSLAQLLDDMQRGADVSRCLVITFDDGYEDNYTFAAPALERYGLTATFFITTNFIGSEKVPWWDKEANVQSEWMSWEQVIDLDRRGFDIGSHTMSHANLRFSSDAGITQEVTESKAVLERKLGHPVRHFAYPYGRQSDISDRGREIIKQAGFDCCLSCFGGSVSAASPPMDLPRIPINDWYASTYAFGLDALRPFGEPGGEYGQAEIKDENILVVSYHLYPDPEVGARRPSELMRFLVDKGYNVEGLGARLDRNSAKDPALEERISGIKVMRVWDPPSVVDWVWKVLKKIASHFYKAESAKLDLQRSSLATTCPKDWNETPLIKIRRNYNALYGLYDARKLWAVFSILCLAAKRFTKRYDIVISSSPPSASQLVGYWIAKLYRAKYVMDFRDPWVENSHITAQATSSIRKYLEKAAERKCVARADLITVTTPGIERMLAERYRVISDKLHVIYNGYDGDIKAPPIKPPGRMCMLYAGTLYLNRNPFPLLKGIAALVQQKDIDRDKVRMTFVGNCKTWEGQSLLEWVREHDLGDVVDIQPPVTLARIEAMISESTVLVNLAQGQKDQVPAKTFDYLASGKEQLLISEPESAATKILTKSGVGFFIDSTAGSDDYRASLGKLYQLVVHGEISTERKNVKLSEFSRSYQYQLLAKAMADNGVMGNLDE